MQSSNENPTFEQIGKPEWDPSGVFRIRYGSGLNDPLPFCADGHPAICGAGTWQVGFVR